jgi:RNA polymerase sigma-70 factor, ECF subfamily
MPNRKHITELKKDFHEAYELHADALFRFSYYKLSDREKAKDIVQDTFVRFWEYVAADGHVENVKAFLYRIANNAIIDNYRKKKELSLDLLEDDGFDPADQDSHHKMARSLDSQTALRLVNELSEIDRTIILMRYVDGLSVKEISEVIDERENTISVKIHRALKQLQELFEKSEKKT